MSDSPNDQSPRLGGQHHSGGHEPALTGDRTLLHLVELLSAPGEETRLWTMRISAIGALREINPPEAAKALEEWRRNHPNEQTRGMNEELKQLYDADVREHKQGNRFGTPEYIAMRQRDADRRARVAAIREAGGMVVAPDYFHGARIFQHGDTPDDAWTAHILAMKAAELGERQARWLAAAAYDRWCMYSGKPQKYGTNYVSDGRRQRLWDVDPATTDEERARWDVPPLAEQIRKAEEATRIDPPGPVGEDAPGWLREAIARWRKQEGW